LTWQPTWPADHPAHPPGKCQAAQSAPDFLCFGCRQIFSGISATSSRETALLTATVAEKKIQPI